LGGAKPTKAPPRGDGALRSPHLQLQTKLKPSEVTTETATTIKPHFTLDLPNTKRFYK